MVAELVFPVSVLLLLLLGELAIILIVKDSDEILVTDLNILLQQILNVTLRKLNVAIRLRDHQVCILQRVPRLSDAQRCRRVAEGHKHLIHRERTNLRANEHAFFALSHLLQHEFALGRSDLLLNKVKSGVELELWNLEVLQSLDSLVEKHLAHLRVLGCLGVFDVKDHLFMHRFRVPTVDVGFQIQLFE